MKTISTNASRSRRRTPRYHRMETRELLQRSVRDLLSDLRGLGDIADCTTARIAALLVVAGVDDRDFFTRGRDAAGRIHEAELQAIFAGQL